jgi:hypothetical protein
MHGHRGRVLIEFKRRTTRKRRLPQDCSKIIGERARQGQSLRRTEQTQTQLLLLTVDYRLELPHLASKTGLLQKFSCSQLRHLSGGLGTSGRSSNARTTEALE